MEEDKNIDEIFGCYKILSFLDFRNNDKYYKCICLKCKTFREIPLNTLKNLRTDRCFCNFSKRTYHGENHTKFYMCWQKLKGRCDNPNDPKYKQYGRRGIIYDPEWRQYLKFKEDMYEEYIKALEKYPDELLSIERIDVNGNYCKENCTFIPMSEQSKNRTNILEFKAIDPDGKIYISKNARQFAIEHNLGHSKICACIRGVRKQHKGWKFINLKNSNTE